MEPAYEVEPSEGGTLEIPSLRMFDRVAGVIIILAGGVVFESMVLAGPGLGNPIAYIPAAACLWWAICYACLPGVKVVADPAGIEFADMTWGAFLRFPRYRVAWRDIVQVGTRRVSTRHGSYIETRVKAKISPDETRQFSVTSMNQGYEAFVEMLKERVDTSATEVAGLGIEPAAIRQAMKPALTARQRVLLVVFTLTSSTLMLAFFLWFFRR